MSHVITALACLVGFIILALYASVAASVYHFRQDHAGPDEPLLPMTLIKPVRGPDDGMRENFEAIADSDPEKALQVIVALESDADPAAAVAQGFAASHLDRDILVLYTGPARGRAGKAHNMIEALSKAKHARVIFSEPTSARRRGCFTARAGLSGTATRRSSDCRTTSMSPTWAGGCSASPSTIISPSPRP